MLPCRGHSISAVGLRRALHPGKAGTWGPILFGLYGIFLIIAGCFHPDPQLGFPSKAPQGIPSSPSGHANIHSIAFSILALAIVASGFVFARRFAAIGKRGWMSYAITSSVSILIFVILGSALMGEGTEFLVFDVDGTRQAARQRALPSTPDLPPAQRRLDEVCAPGYTGRKRGETVRTRTTVLQAHTHQWVGTFSGATGAGNGDYRGELRSLVSLSCSVRLYDPCLIGVDQEEQSLLKPIERSSFPPSSEQMEGRAFPSPA